MEIDKHYSLGVRVDSAKLGLGVFAIRRFEAEEYIGPITGKIHTDSEYDNDYCMDLGEDRTLEPEAPFRYLNHCCTPNCQLVLCVDEDDTDHEETDAENSLWVETLRDIEPGEQLTIDYNWPAEHTIPCLCGSDECRGWIVDPDQLHLIEHYHNVDIDFEQNEHHFPLSEEDAAFEFEEHDYSL